MVRNIPHAMKKPYIQSDTGQFSFPQVGQARRHLTYHVKFRSQPLTDIRQAPNINFRPVPVVLAAVPDIVAHSDKWSR